MPITLDDRLVVAVASSALFGLEDSDRVFRAGDDACRQHQREHENDVLAPGVAFPLMRRLLGLNGTVNDQLTYIDGGSRVTPGRMFPLVSRTLPPS